MSKNFEYLSMVSKLCGDIESNLGLGNKVSAEFITELGRECETVDEFDAKLKENGAEMPNCFVRTLLTDIHAILPPKVKGKYKSGAKEGIFSALKIKDSRDRVNELEREIEEEARKQIPEEYPLFDQDGDGMLCQQEGVDEEIEIELNDDIPPFLHGLSCCNDMPPVEIFKNPEGPLSRAAAFQSALMNERMEKQLMKEFARDGDGMHYQKEGEEIELIEDMPPFLPGLSCDMSPVGIFKNPGGSLSCAAVFQSAVMKERMEKQLMKDYPLFYAAADGDGMLYKQEGEEGELEIDVNEHKLSFLRFCPELDHQKSVDCFGFGGYWPKM